MRALTKTFSGKTYRAYLERTDDPCDMEELYATQKMLRRKGFSTRIEKSPWGNVRLWIRKL